jgi:hypothetical protein
LTDMVGLPNQIGNGETLPSALQRWGVSLLCTGYYSNHFAKGRTICISL